MNVNEIKITRLDYDDTKYYDYLAPHESFLALKTGGAYAIGASIKYKKIYAPVGILIFSYSDIANKESVAIRWINVWEKLRGHGVGTKLLGELLKVLKEIEVNKISVSIPDAPHYAGVTNFFNVNCFSRIHSVGRDLYATVQEIKDIGYFKKLKVDVSVRDLRYISNSRILQLKNKLPPKSYGNMPLEIMTGDSYFDRDLSSVIFSENGNIATALLLRRVSSGDIEVRILYKDPAAKMENVGKVIARTYRQICSRCEDNTIIHIPCCNDGVEKLVKKALPEVPLLKVINYSVDWKDYDV